MSGPVVDDPLPGADPPARWRRRLAAGWGWLRTTPGLLVVTLLTGLLLGWALASTTAPTPEDDARRAIESTLLPIAVDADGIWTSSADARDAVSEALVALRREDDARLVEDNVEAWLEAYDAVLIRLAGLDLPASARPVQRQVISGVTLSRDAVEVLEQAALTDDPAARRDLTTEVGRLRQRSEQLVQGARASTGDLGGQRVDVAPLPPITTFPEGRR